jgi:hypothetical protein
LHGTEQQHAAGAIGRQVGRGSHPGGQDVDVLLDTLIRVVDGAVDESAAIVSPAFEPVTGESVGEPDPPGHDEALRQVDVQHVAGDEQRRHDAEDHDRHPKAVYARLFHGLIAGGQALHGGLDGRGQVVGLIAEQHGEAHRDDDGQQQHPEHQPDPDAVRTGEVAAGDPPELAAPRGEQSQQCQHTDQAHGADHPG